MSQCQEGVILMKNGWKKMPISYGFEKTNNNSNKAFCFACKKSIDLNVMGKSACKKHGEHVLLTASLQSSKNKEDRYLCICRTLC